MVVVVVVVVVVVAVVVVVVVVGVGGVGNPGQPSWQSINCGKPNSILPQLSTPVNGWSWHSSIVNVPTKGMLKVKGNSH